MEKTDYAGIDYGLGRTNIDDNGIRYGVIPIHEVTQAWCDESEGFYGKPMCPTCFNEVMADFCAEQNIKFDRDRFFDAIYK